MLVVLVCWDSRVGGRGDYDGIVSAGRVVVAVVVC